MYRQSNFPKRKIPVFDKHMAYVDEGSGEPIVLLHGNPTSSYLWRNVIGHLTDRGRCIAPDLIGMGDSDKLDSGGPDAYRFVDHRQYLEQFLDRLGLDGNVFFVLHDWGSALGFDWARRHPGAVRGIAYMEAIVQNLTWADWPENARDIFKALRSQDGEKMILEDNIFVEKILPTSILRELTETEMAEYRRPFANPGEDRRPTLTWPREIPIHGEPVDVAEIVNAYAKWMETADMPKLFINADPGAILVGAQREYCRAWKNQEETTVKGLHFIQEDSGNEIGEAIADFMQYFHL